MRIKSWSEADSAAREYLLLNSRLERIAEELKEFALARKEEIGRESELPRTIPGKDTGLFVHSLLIGFEKIPVCVAVPSDALQWLESRDNSRFVRQKLEAKKAELKNYLKSASEAILEQFSSQGIILVDGYERFYLKLNRLDKTEITERREQR